MKKMFTTVVERDEDGYYVGSVVELPGCHTQAKSLDELTKRIKEAIELYLESEKEIGRGLLRKIIRDAKLTREDFLKLSKEI